jgi:hypothetical protein
MIDCLEPSATAAQLNRLVPGGESEMALKWAAIEVAQYY